MTNMPMAHNPVHTTLSGLAALLLMLLIPLAAHADYILIPMNEDQTNHLKAYGVVFNHVEGGGTGQWLLNYEGGSFLLREQGDVLRRARVRNVQAERISSGEASQIVEEVEQPNVNMAALNLETAPEIAVYAPEHTLPWDDAVLLALEYAEVSYDIIYNEEVLNGELDDYDWLHLHHEDFTGQFGRFWGTYRNAPWYQRQVRDLEQMARSLGFERVSDMKLEVVQTMKDYIGRGGFLFAMCSGTDTFDIALAAADTDIVPDEIEGRPADPDANERLDYSNTLAFTDFSLSMDPAEYRHADIDVENVDQRLLEVDEEMDFFTLFDFSAKWDPVPAMLTQNHRNSIKGFYGQTTAFRTDRIKSNVVKLARNAGREEAKYIHGNYGQGTFTFYGGHDPEDYTHRVGDPPTDLDLHPNSPGYRLILNNILFPAVEEQEMQTFNSLPAIHERTE